MRLFWDYLKQHRLLFCMLLCCVLIFSAISLMYEMPPQALLYPVFLCIFICALFAAVDFIHMQKKHRQLSEISTLSANLISELPDADSIVEKDLQSIINNLLQEIKEAEECSKTQKKDMTDYYTVWAHQIKTPISAMRLTLQNSDTASSRRLNADLGRIEQYVSMVMAYLRLDSDVGDYVFHEVNADDVIGAALKKFAYEFIDRHLSLSYEPVRLCIVTDEKWLGFVLEQILSNALKYTREGGIKIYLREPDVLCIRDTGIGIDAADLPRIFEKGYTGINGRYDKSASGLGLYLCSRVCEKLGIGIRAESQPDIGTTVYLDLSQHKVSGD